MLRIDFKGESKDDSESGRMEQFRIKAAHQAKKKNCKETRKEKNLIFPSFYSTIISAFKRIDIFIYTTDIILTLTGKGSIRSHFVESDRANMRRK